MSSDIILYMLMATGGAFVVIVIAFLMLRKKMQSSTEREIKRLREGTQERTLTAEVIYQKLYMVYLKTPFLKRYLLKIRRKLEIINLDDEYLTRGQTSRILTNTALILIPLTIAIIAICKENIMVMSFLLIFEVFMADTIIGGMADKIDNKLLKAQVGFFSEIRHAYHEFNMIEEAIYQVSQDDEEPEMSRQAEKIYEVLISDDPEQELEKYYDIAPNNYLKEFAGVSYLTKEFGDRTVNGASLYLKNLNNITQEMQLEILKRDKLDYVFQSLAVISIVPVLFIEPIKDWAISQFSFTASFYDGKAGLIMQIALLALTFICYILIRKLQDNGNTKMDTKNTQNPWQAKLYSKKFFKIIVDAFTPKQGTKDYKKLKDNLKKAASKDKMEWVIVNKLTLCIVTFIVSLIVIMQLHALTINSVYTDPTVDYDIIGQMSDKDLKSAMEVTESDNEYINKYKGDITFTIETLVYAMEIGIVNKDYVDSSDDEITVASERIFEKIQLVNTANMQWFELLIAMVFAIISYNVPIWMLIFQAKLRQLEMEDEVMQFQTIILMLMKIERVNVEMILEWIERYSNIFKEPISKCVNNFEAGPWEALEELKNEVAYDDLIRIVESLQAAVEKIPIAQAFDELDTERDYYQAKRKESNDRLITKKAMLGKGIGFAPMIVLFCGYLIVPLVGIGLTSMSTSLSSMS